MLHRKASRLITLAIFLSLSLTLALPGQAQRADARPASEPPMPPPAAPALAAMRSATAGAAGVPPQIAASPLLDQWRAQGGRKGGKSLLDQRVLRGIQSNTQPAHPAPAAVQPGALGNLSNTHSGAIPSVAAPAPQQAPQPAAAAAPAQDATGVLGPRPAKSSSANIALQPGSSCLNLTVDSQVNDPANWPGYDRKTYYTGDYTTSPPYSLLMIEKGAPGYAYDNDDDIINANRQVDLDAIGQVLSVPTNTDSITVSFNFRYDPGSATGTDALYYEFYYANGDQLGQFIANGHVNVAPYADGGWWTQTERFDDPTFLQAVRGQRVVLVISTYNNNNGRFAVVRIDDISAVACQPPGTIQGTVHQSGAGDLSDALILLTYTPPSGGDLELLSLTLPDVSGNYQFTDVPTLPSGGKFQISFLNYSLTNTIDNSRVGFWAGPAIGSFAAGQNLTVASFDIGDVQLGSPDSYASAAMSGAQAVTFGWQKRNVAGDRYQFCIYDQQTVYPPGSQSAGQPVYLCSSILPLGTTSIAIDRSDFPADYDFHYDHPYSWYVNIYGAGSDGASTQYGLSFYEHVITFKQSSTPPPNNPPPPNPNPPPGHQAAWTVMIYMAGDNNLGDTLRTPNPVSNLQGQWAALKRLAASYPNVNLVTLTDFYGNTGTQFCYLKPGVAPQCQELGEQNTADPAVLANFVNKSLSLYPASHTMLIISDHGHGIAGVATDETTPNAPSMTPDLIRQAFNGANLSARKLDILFYNTCLMGGFEPAFDASAYAKYMVASSDLVWVLNIYDRLLPLLNSPDPRAVAAGIVTAYGQSVDAAIPGSYRTMAAYDLGRAAAVNSALSTLADALKNGNLAVTRDAIAAIRAQAQVYDSSGNDLLDQVADTSGKVVAQEEDAFVDLRHLATLLKNSANPLISTAVKSAATNLLNALGPIGGVPGQSLVIAAQQQTGDGDGGAPKNFANAGGLWVYFPNGTKYGGQPTYSDAYLYQGAYASYNTSTSWDDFLRSYLSGTIAQGRGGIARGRGGIARGGVPLPGGVVRLKVYLPMVRRT